MDGMMEWLKNEASLRGIRNCSHGLEMILLAFLQEFCDH